MEKILEIDDLHVSVGDKPVLKGVNLTLMGGEVAAIMGPNGSGKSTLSYVLAGREGYNVTRGQIRYKGQDLLSLDPDERARAGLFLAFQYPLEIPGVGLTNFLKTSVNAVRKHRQQTQHDAVGFLRIVKEKAHALGIAEDMLKRMLNVGFSGGEKKRVEILQMQLLEPSLAILDETDSGLDIDSLRTVATGINDMRRHDRAMLVITHYKRLLDYLTPDRIHVFADGVIQRSGGPELADELERTGYGTHARSVA